MNKHRIMPLAFTLSFAIFVPLLAQNGTPKKPPSARTSVGKLLGKVDRGASAIWMEWHAKNQAYTELVGLDQR